LRGDAHASPTARRALRRTGSPTVRSDRRRTSGAARRPIRRRPAGPSRSRPGNEQTGGGFLEPRRPASAFSGPSGSAAAVGRDRPSRGRRDSSRGLRR
jgi:hypothetical protein